MEFQRLEIPDVVLISPKKIGDRRGYFMESFRQDRFRSEVGEVEFVQENRSFSSSAGTIRGLHFQTPPKAQGKLVSCAMGELLDVAVDIRKGSPTFGRHVFAKLTADGGEQLWVPPGFAHGFCTLTTDVIISYKVTDYYSPDHDRGLLWCDEALGIDWPVNAGTEILSDKDKVQPRLCDLMSGFIYSA